MTTPGDGEPYRPGGAPDTPDASGFPPPPAAPPAPGHAHGHPHDGQAGGHGIEGRIVGHGSDGFGTPSGPPGYGTSAPYATPADYGTPGYGAPADFAAGASSQPGYGTDPGYGTGAGYGTDPGYGTAPGYGTDPSYGYGNDPAYGSGAGYGTDHGFPAAQADTGTYVPEPLAGQMPAEADPGAAFGLPSSGGAWGGNAPAQDGYQGPAGVDGWGQTPQAAQPWEHAAAADAHPGHGPAQPQSPQQQWSPPHAYAGGQDPQAPGRPFGPAYGTAAAFGGGVEQTAVLPVIDEEPSASEPAAPVRTGSPIIPPGIQPAALTAALGLLMAGGAALGKPGLALVLVVLEAVTAAGWFRLNGMWPARQGIVLAFLAGVTADIALLAAGGGHNAEVLLGTLGVWLPLVLVLQLRHHGSADERLSSLTATSASTLLTVVAAGYLATAASGAGSDPVVVGAIAVAAATLVRAVRVPGGEAVSLALSVLVALVTGLVTGPATGLGAPHGVLLAAASGACALVGLRVASYDFPSRFVHFTAGVALPLTAAAPVVYLLGNALH
ncbi:hypothetical protein SAMN05216267_1024110 [Actinacidiphila rubida]|uniref:Uncharacterized protein n=1 Tax=Actinacidiphila rubida TaxID=310780 RepID=A0A1H8P4J9_9ACTN|nr:hypothetical protein [Actinacidiphila rubida]SEO36869.1 hypothetical protein SAMN05216267_1024110 [Actinacidiphila rubida]